MNILYHHHTSRYGNRTSQKWTGMKCITFTLILVPNANTSMLGDSRTRDLFILPVARRRRWQCYNCATQLLTLRLSSCSIPTLAAAGRPPFALLAMIAGAYRHDYLARLARDPPHRYRRFPSPFLVASFRA